MRPHLIDGGRAKVTVQKMGRLKTEDIELVGQSGLFDEAWYLEQHPEFIGPYAQPLRHYLEIGWRRGDAPSPYFDAAHYLSANPDVAAAGVNPLLHYVRFGRNEGRAMRAMPQTDAADDIAFSVILATYNRAGIIEDSIRSILAQTHRNFELIIVDDGSADGTEALVRERFAAEFADGRITYIRFSRNLGVSAARNAGLLAARNPWIAYVDSDNVVDPRFLDAFARRIVMNEGVRTLYARFFQESVPRVVGRAFDLEALRRDNYIDLGVFVHHAACFQELGGFDISLRRLVDWDLILKYLHRYPPVFVGEVLMTYRDRDGKKLGRITDREAVTLPMARILRRYDVCPTVTSVIVCYNQAEYIAEAIESVLAQRGDFYQDIVVADDGSTDGTAEIVQRYCEKNRWRMRSIGDGINRGISGNFRRSFATAAGAYLAILEGDDYWSDRDKIAKQVAFLEANPDCSMVFSKIEVEAAGSRRRTTLERQDRIRKNKLDAADFLADPSLNLIANLSSCMFRSDLMKELPGILYRHRLSEMGLAFHLDRFGAIGYLNRPMSVYRMHAQGTWSGASAEMKLSSGRQVREVAKLVARDRYKGAIQDILDRHYTQAPTA
ncbi:glycosyl transferase family 2 [Ancylobacter novellus DSM 506]|uniref:Glycosyl transferase family 2 n=2 Tax=Ancylobacter novellus TaxID=921 RepID=D7A8W1_ANCN5|nr:glycosyl transferase family 2 [Ancylobacter novellus DSM 506]